MDPQKFNVEAIAKLPLPEEPPKPAAVLYEEEQERKKKEEEERRRKEQANKLTTDEEKALSWLGDYGISADELADYMGISIQKASLFLTRLVVKEKAERYIEKRKAYFTRKD